jgi:hypothetical protein
MLTAPLVQSGKTAPGTEPLRKPRPQDTGDGHRHIVQTNQGDAHPKTQEDDHDR